MGRRDRGTDTNVGAMPMTLFEQRANNFQTAIEMAKDRVEDFGYGDEPAQEIVSRVYGSFIIWLTACEEARLQNHYGITHSAYKRYVIDSLPEVDDASWQWSDYYGQGATLKRRASALWGLRTAFAHGDGDLRLVGSATNKKFAIGAANDLPGVQVSDQRVSLTAAIFHPAIKTVVQLQEVIPAQLCTRGSN